MNKQNENGQTVTVDTPEFRELLQWPDETPEEDDAGFLTFVEHIDQYASAVAAKAVAEAEAPLKRQNLELQRRYDEQKLQEQRLETALARASAPQQHAQVALSADEIEDLMPENKGNVGAFPCEVCGYVQVSAQWLHDFARNVHQASQQPAAAPEPCADPAQCEKQGCANPRGRCEEAAAPAVQVLDEAPIKDAIRTAYMQGYDDGKEDGKANSGCSRYNPTRIDWKLTQAVVAALTKGQKP